MDNGGLSVACLGGIKSVTARVSLSLSPSVTATSSLLRAADNVITDATTATRSGAVFAIGAAVKVGAVVEAIVSTLRMAASEGQLASWSTGIVWTSAGGGGGGGATSTD